MDTHKCCCREGGKGGGGWGVSHQSPPRDNENVELTSATATLKKTKTFFDDHFGDMCSAYFKRDAAKLHISNCREGEYHLKNISGVCNSHDPQCFLDYGFCVQAGKSEVFFIFFPTARAATWGDNAEHEARRQSCTNTIIGLAFTGPSSP